MLDAALAALCAAHIMVNTQGVVTALTRIEQPLAQRAMKVPLPDNGSLFETSGLEEWNITIKFPKMMIVFEDDGPLRWKLGQVVSFEGELCGTPFELNPSQ